MHLRKLTFTVGLVGALCSTWAYGLGLGEITLNSALNQPLDAEIKLLQVRNLTEEDILIELASSEDFQRFGVDRAFFLQQLEFDVRMDHPGGPVVRVSTDQPVREPYMIFLLEAQSPSGGRLLREYTLLLDLPVFADEPAQPVQGVQTRPEPQRAQAPASRPQPAQQQPLEPQPVQRQGEPPRAQPAPQRQVTSRPGAEVYGPVQANDTLWEIASRVRPSRSVSVQQTMLAIQRLNPDAFINGNINLLKRGQVLRVPDQSEVESLDQRSAISEVAVQNDQWSSGFDRQVAGAELEASSSRPSAPRSEEGPRGQLTLAAPGDTQDVGERSGAGDTSASTEALENELAITSEQLDATRRNNDELNQRVAELEEQITTMERLLEVSSEEMRALQLAGEQKSAEQAEEASGEVRDAAAETAPVTGDGASSETDAAGDASAPAAPEDESAEAPTGEAESESNPAEANPAESKEAEAASPEPVAQPSKSVVVPRQPQQPSWQETAMTLVMDNLWYLLVALLVILAGVVLILHRRGQEEFDNFDDLGDEDIFADMEEAPAEVEAFEDPAGWEEDFDLGQEEEPAPEEDIEPELPTEAETGDAVSEADIYIAYGKFDQAEEMLRKAASKEPDNMDVRLKLLEVHAEAKDVKKFDREYGQLMALGDASANNRAAELRNSIPGAAPYEGEMPAGGGQADDNLNFSGEELNLGGDDFSLESEGGSGDLDDLTFDLNGGSDEQAAGGDEQAFDFNLDMDENSSDSGDNQLGDLDFSADLSDDGDSSGSSQNDGGLAFNLELEDDSSTDNRSQDKGSLDLDGLDEDSVESPVLTDVDDGQGSEGALDLDFNLGDADSDNDLSFELDDASHDNSASHGDADVLTDLEFSTDDLSLDPQQDSGGDLEFASSEPARPKAGSASSLAADDADDFDMDLGDLDLEALDQEMDALVGEVDDLGDDDDVALASPATRVTTAARKTASDAEMDLKLDLDLDALGSPDEDIEADMPDLSASTPAESHDFSFDDEAESGATEELDQELDFLAEADEVATKLDLARAYIDMGDQDGAKDILDEVSNEGSDEQKKEAAQLLDKIV